MRIVPLEVSEKGIQEFRFRIEGLLRWILLLNQFLSTLSLS